MHQTDTICAISTPPGIGGIAVVRITGPKAIAIADSIWHGLSLAQTPSHTARVGYVNDTDGSKLDQAVATVYRAPRSFTGDDTVELATHGSRYVQRQILTTLTHAGCRIADPGEFTRRAFMAGKLDLAQAEAVADVIASSSRAAHRIAVSQLDGAFSRRLDNMRQQLIDLAALLELELDFSEEDVEFASRQRLQTLAENLLDEITRLLKSFDAGQAIKEGIPVAIIGAPNVGKSSLLNRLLGNDRAIVSDIPGTTRDTVEETLDINGYLFRFIDTAGLRDTDDPVEKIGIDRTRLAKEKATIILNLTTPSATQPTTTDAAHTAETNTAAPDASTARTQAIINIINKVDLLPDGAAHTPPTDVATATDTTGNTATTTLKISAKTGYGIESLRQQLAHTAATLTGTTDGESDIITNARHAAALAAAAESTRRVTQGLNQGLPPDLVAQDLRQTIDHLGAITGAVTSADILATIFARFCIGK